MQSLNLLIPSITTRAKSNLNWKFTSTDQAPPARTSCSRNTNSSPQPQQQQLNLSVLRFTLGIPGLDESYLPRYIGYAFGGLLLLNNFVGSDSSSITPAQLRTEALGLSLAAFSAVVPYFGKFLKGSSPTDKKSIPEGADQIFVMSKDVVDTVKEDLAWGTYVLLRNTNSISVLISVQDSLCARGYWKTPKDVSKEILPDLFGKQIPRIGFANLSAIAYFPQSAESEILAMLPDGARSLLVQPIMGAQKERSSQTENSIGFVLLASSMEYAYNDKDRAWITAVANKFAGKSITDV